MQKSNHTKIFLTLALAIALIVMSSFSVFALTISNVVVSPSQVAPGDTAKITIEIENNFEDDMENINIGLDFSSLTIPVAPYAGSSEESIEELDSDDEESITFNVIVLPEAASGVYKIPVLMSYNFVGENETVEKEGTISIVVNSPPKLRVVLEGNLIEGAESDLVLRIINDGLSDIKLASVEVGSAQGIIINSPTSEYLGNIDSDDFDSLDLKVFASQKTSSFVSIPLTITYKDSTNKDYTQNEIASVKIYSQEEAKKLGLIKGPNYTLLLITLVLIVLYIVYRVRKRNKKRKAQGA